MMYNIINADNLITGYKLSGHTGYSEYGSDIVVRFKPVILH